MVKYQCPWCPVYTGNKGGLTSHLSTHPQGNFFHCGEPTCGRTEYRQDRLRDHVLAAHNRGLYPAERVRDTAAVQWVADQLDRAHIIPPPPAGVAAMRVMRASQIYQVFCPPTGCQVPIYWFDRTPGGAPTLFPHIEGQEVFEEWWCTAGGGLTRTNPRG